MASLHCIVKNSYGARKVRLPGMARLRQAACKL